MVRVCQILSRISSLPGLESASEKLFEAREDADEIHGARGVGVRVSCPFALGLVILVVSSEILPWSLLFTFRTWEVEPSRTGLNEKLVCQVEYLVSWIVIEWVEPDQRFTQFGTQEGV